MLEATDALAELGLDVDDFGGGTVLLSSYPALLGRRPPHEILAGVVDYLRGQGPAADAGGAARRPAGDDGVQGGGEGRRPAHARRRSRTCCTCGELAEDSHHCPHGRPTSLLFSRQELDRQFRRI